MPGIVPGSRDTQNNANIWSFIWLPDYPQKQRCNDVNSAMMTKEECGELSCLHPVVPPTLFFQRPENKLLNEINDTF